VKVELGGRERRKLFGQGASCVFFWKYRSDFWMAFGLESRSRCSVADQHENRRPCRVLQGYKCVSKVQAPGLNKQVGRDHGEQVDQVGRDCCFDENLEPVQLVRES
jgi:hypothetical protein